ncbi:hypothetical protein CC2G_014158 [Coprinopsis cinerea AmutBmut pab1-1]|nr:hypothetical protein CC2G_014158 [Coprinopsis cinerea AmutBmut pab1-1]
MSAPVDTRAAAHFAQASAAYASSCLRTWLAWHDQKLDLKRNKQYTRHLSVSSSHVPCVTPNMNFFSIHKLLCL